MKRILIIAALALSLLIGGHARPAHAAILPNCDKTVYYVKDESKNATCSTTSTAGCIDGIGISPERYDELANKSSDPQAWKKAHAPIISTNTACGFNDFIQLFINLATYGLGLLAVVGVAVTVWGGFGFLLAMGSPEKIKEAKQTIWGAILGTFIVLIAFVMVNWVVGMLTGTGPVLFAGTEHEEYFYGARCPSFKECGVNNLHYNPGDGCKDGKKNGNAVTKAQTLLAQLGCYTGSIDGCYGPETKQAVIDFQSKNATFYEIELTDGGISSVEEWQMLEDAADGAGGLLSCGTLSLTATGNVGFDGDNVTVSRPAITVPTNGTVTFKNESAGVSSSEALLTGVTITFDQVFNKTPEYGYSAETSYFITRGAEKSLTFNILGTFNYTITYIHSDGLERQTFTTTGKVNVINA